MRENDLGADRLLAGDEVIERAISFAFAAQQLHVERLCGWCRPGPKFLSETTTQVLIRHESFSYIALPRQCLHQQPVTALAIG